MLTTSAPSPHMSAIPHGTLTTSAASPHKSAIPHGTLVAGTALSQQAGHTVTGQTLTGPHTSNNLQSQGGVVTAQQNLPEPPEVQAWRDAGRPNCNICGKSHAPPHSEAKAAERHTIKQAKAQNTAQNEPPNKKRSTASTTFPRLVNRRQNAPPPVSSGPHGNRTWPSLPVPPANTAALPAPAAARVAPPSQAGTQPPYHPRPNAPYATASGTNALPDQWAAQLPQLFQTLAPNDRLMFMAHLHQGTVGQLIQPPAAISAGQSHNTTDAAAPGRGSQTSARPSTTSGQSNNANVPEGSRPSGGVKGKQPQKK